MKEIQLTKGKVALVDDEDYDYLMQWKWLAKPSRGTFYAARLVATSRKLGKRKHTLFLMHKVLMNTPDNLVTDHEDNNGLNNQKNNLRICTHSQNKKNRLSSKTGTSKYLGVSVFINRYINKKGVLRKYWQCAITANGKTKYLGLFPYTPEGEIAAAKRYDQEALKEHKDFANLNFKNRVTWKNKKH